jgi:hypothetical protein
MQSEGSHKVPRTGMELKVLHQRGWTISALAREFGLDWRTVKRTGTMAKAEQCFEAYLEMGADRRIRKLATHVQQLCSAGGGVQRTLRTHALQLVGRVRLGSTGQTA